MTGACPAGGLPLSEAEGMPSLSGMSPSDAAAFLQGNKKVSPPALSPAMLSASLHEKSCIKARLMLGSCHPSLLKKGGGLVHQGTEQESPEASSEDWPVSSASQSR